MVRVHILVLFMSLTSLFFSLSNSLKPLNLEYGDLEQLHPMESYEQIKARRLSNWNIFKSACENLNTIQIPSLVELYQPSNEYIAINDNKTLTISGNNSALIFYPFVPRLGTVKTFDLQYGGSLKLRRITSKCAERRNLFESYKCVLKKGSDAKKIELLGTLRGDFWESIQIGQTVYYSWSESVLGETNSVESFDSLLKTITLNNDINASVGNNTSGDEVWFGTDFYEDVSRDDYLAFGKHWVRGQASQNYYRLWSFISHQPASSTGKICNITLENATIQNFNNNVVISSGAFALRLIGNVNLDYGEVSLAAFARSQINGQYIGSPTKEQAIIDNATLSMTENGLRSVGSIDFISSQNIYGAGAYIHPTVIVNIARFSGVDNVASTFRMYSSSIETTTNYNSWIGDFVCTGSGELDLRTPNSQILEVDNYSGTSLLTMSGNFKINTSAVIGSLGITTLSEPVPGVDHLMEINNAVINGGFAGSWSADRADGLTIMVNNSTWYIDASGIPENSNGYIRNEGAPIKKLELNNIQLRGKSGIATFTPGVTPSGTNVEKFIRPSGFSHIEINNMVTDYMVGYLFLNSSSYVYPPNNNSFVEINDSEINLSRLMPTNYSSTRTFLSNQIRGQRTIIRSFNYSGIGYNLPLSFTPKIASKSKNIIAQSKTYNVDGPSTSFSISGTLEIDLEHNEYFVNSGTINRIVLLSYPSDTTDNSTCLSGNIILHAVGGNVVLNKWDATTNEWGNILNDVTILSGTSKTFTCNNLAVFAKSENSTVTPTIATGNGNIKEYKGVLPDYLIVKSAGFSLTANSITGFAGSDGLIIGAGIDPLSFIDYNTGTYYILFDNNLGNGVDLIVQYDKYNDWRVSGVYNEVA